MMLLFATPHHSLPMPVLSTSHGLINRADDFESDKELLSFFGELEQESTPQNLLSKQQVSKLSIRVEATTLPGVSNNSGSKEDVLLGNQSFLPEATNTPLPVNPSDINKATGTSYCTRPLRDCYRRQQCSICIDRARQGRPPCSQTWRNYVISTCKRKCGDKVVVCFW